MFPAHRPRVYRSAEGCCICGSKSSSSRFISSKKYEEAFKGCFDVAPGSRTGNVCNACVLLVKRWQKLPENSKRTWGHVVDGKTKGRRHSRTRSGSSSSVNEEEGAAVVATMPEETLDRGQDSAEASKAECDKAIESNETPLMDSFTSSRSCSPTLSDTADTSGDGRISTACQTTFFMPQLEKTVMKFPYLDLSGWRREDVCCGTIFKGPNGEVLVDPRLLRPTCHCNARQNKRLQKQNSEGT